MIKAIREMKRIQSQYSKDDEFEKGIRYGIDLVIHILKNHLLNLHYEHWSEVFEREKL
jgi:hypothetical protein